MPAGSRTLLDWPVYISARLGAAAVGMVRTETALRWAANLGHLLYRIDRRHRRRALANLAFACPEWPKPQRRWIAAESFSHFFRLAVELFSTPRLIHAHNFSDRIELTNLAPALELFNSGRPLLLVTGHYGNWEVLGSLLAMLGYHVEALARPIDNAPINDWLLQVRQRRGLRIISKWQQELDRMDAVLDAGGMLGIVADQNAGGRGLFVPFFDRLASTHKSIALLAVRRGIPVVCGYARRRGLGCHFELGVNDIIRPEDWESAPDPIYYVTARFMRAIESMVREEPQQYLWMHRRWKTRPRFEQAGGPIPPSLRRKLESLPWMDPQAFERLSRPPAAELPDRRWAGR